MGTKITDKITNIEIKLKPVATDKLATFEILKLYLQIFIFICFIFSLFN